MQRSAETSLTHATERQTDAGGATITSYIMTVILKSFQHETEFSVSRIFILLLSRFEFLGDIYQVTKEGNKFVGKKAWLFKKEKQLRFRIKRMS